MRRVRIENGLEQKVTRSEAKLPPNRVSTKTQQALRPQGVLLLEKQKTAPVSKETKAFTSAVPLFLPPMAATQVRRYNGRSRAGLLGATPLDRLLQGDIGPPRLSPLPPKRGVLCAGDSGLLVLIHAIFHDNDTILYAFSGFVNHFAIKSGESKRPLLIDAIHYLYRGL